MNEAKSTGRWKDDNADQLVQCRWGAVISLEACRKYQEKAPRHVTYFNRLASRFSRINADYLACAYPTPCPHFMSDMETMECRALRKSEEADRTRERKVAAAHARAMDRLVSPDFMLEEGDKMRSLIIRQEGWPGL